MHKLEFQKFIDFVRSDKLYNTSELITLHEPRFRGNEKKYLNDCIDSTFVSSVGKYVDRFEQLCAEYTGAQYAVAVVNGTCALHVALILSGVTSGDEVITQPLTFVATANAISYTGASPIFVDVDIDTMGLSPNKLETFLSAKAEMVRGFCVNRKTGKKIKACVPMHTFGHPCRIDSIKEICDRWNIVLVEDAAESLGSFYKSRHTGTFGLFGILSFNGNKTITCGGGGMILTNDITLAKKAKHLTTTAKVPHKWEFVHDERGFNYRLSNLSAALGCAQMEQLDDFLKSKRYIAEKYNIFFRNNVIQFFNEPEFSKSNFWLNAVVFENVVIRNFFLEFTNDNNVMTRPIWKLMSDIDIYRNCESADLTNAKWLEERVVNIPSSAL